MDYIVNEKLKIAKRMLKEPGAKVYNVANDLGCIGICANTFDTPVSLVL